MADKSSLTFSFCGEYEVDALALSSTIKSLVEISSEIARVEFSDVKFKMSVKAVSPGSLMFDFVAAVVSEAQSLLAPGTMDYAANLISVISASFTIKKFLKGKRPKEIAKNDDNIVIKNRDGSSLQLPANAGVYFLNSCIDQSITNIIHSAELSPGVTGISIDTNEKVTIQRDEFKECATKVELEPTHEVICTTRHNETLFIRQPDFAGEYKWRFRGDQTFSASVEDVDFLEKLKIGAIVLSAKTYIIADVQVTVYLGPDGMPDESKPVYRITKVHSVHTAGEGQLKLDI